jgi:glycosyltransferase involved in cell wall biosynthesis
MKILISSGSFPPNKDGISEASSLMALAILEKGWDVEIATEPTVPLRQAYVWNGIQINEFKITTSSKFPYRLEGELELYQRFLMDGKWDVIIFHGYGWSIRSAVPVLNNLKAKMILVSHGYGALKWTPVNKFPFGLASLFRSIVQSLWILTWLKKIDRIVYLSKRKDWKSFYDHRLASMIAHSGIRVIPNGVDTDVRMSVLSQFRDSFGVPKESFLFLCVANFSRRKDQGFAARAFRKACIPNATLVFIGSDFNEWSDKFQKEDAESPHVDFSGRIIWLEKLDRQSTLAAFAECDAFVLSADHEAQPIALLEAMREQKPWIARDAGCISEMPGGICVGSEMEMAGAMRIVYNNKSFKEARAIEGRRAIEILYNLESYKSAYISLIQEITS